jgi:hypothetical protein
MYNEIHLGTAYCMGKLTPVSKFNATLLPVLQQSADGTQPMTTKARGK